MRAEGRQEPVAERVHPPHRRLRPGTQTVVPPPAGDPVEDRRVAGDDRDRYVVAGVLAGDDGGRLVVAEHDHDEVVVAVRREEA